MHETSVDVISTEILCGDPFISDRLSLFHLAFLQDEVMTILSYFFFAITLYLRLFLDQDIIFYF